MSSPANQYRRPRAHRRSPGPPVSYAGFSPARMQAAAELENAGRAFAAVRGRRRGLRLQWFSLALALLGVPVLLLPVWTGRTNLGIGAGILLLVTATFLTLTADRVMRQGTPMGRWDALRLGVTAADGIENVPVCVSTLLPLEPDRAAYLTRLSPAQQDTARQLEEEGYDGTLGQLAATAVALLE